MANYRLNVLIGQDSGPPEFREIGAGEYPSDDEAVDALAQVARTFRLAYAQPTCSLRFDFFRD